MSNDLKQKTDIAKDQYKLFKDQIKITNNNIEDSVKVENDVKAEDGVKTEDGVRTNDGKIIANVHRKYIGDELEDLINNIFKYGLKDKDLHFAIISNRYHQ